MLKILPVWFFDKINTMSDGNKKVKSVRKKKTRKKGEEEKLKFIIINIWNLVRRFFSS